MWTGYNLVHSPATFFTIFLIGLQQGSVYALVALGYTLVYGILQLINFAHGDVFALTGLFASSLITNHFNLERRPRARITIIFGLLAVFLIAMAFGAIVNAAIEFVAYRRLRNAPRLAVLITAVGMSFIVQNISLVFFDVNFRSIPPLISEGNVFTIGGVSLGLADPVRRGRHDPGADHPELAREEHAAGQGDARDGPGPRGLGDDGDQRQPHDLVHLPAGRRASRGSGRCSSSSSSTSATTRASSSA